MFVEPEVDERVVTDRAHRNPVADCEGVRVVRTQTEVGADVMDVKLKAKHITQLASLLASLHYNQDQGLAMA